MNVDMSLRGEARMARMALRFGLMVSVAAIPLTGAAAQSGTSAAAGADAGSLGEDAIVITGQRASQARAIELKREAIGVIDVAASDEIGRLPDRNVAEVVERLPGMGVTYDQGEGRYVSIRGIPSELNNYTVNGFELGNPDGSTRALPLDVVSGQLLNRVEVVKAKTADLDAQGIGGSINLVTQTAFDFRDPFTVQVSAQAGHQELNDKVPIRGEASVAGRFGADQQFGILLGASYSDRTFTSYGLYPDDWRPVPGAARGGLPINIKYTDYSLKRERVGASGSFDWRPNDRHSFYARALYSKFTEDEYRQRYRLDFATDDIVEDGNLTFAPDGYSGTATDTERRQDLRLEYKEKSILALMAGGSSSFQAWQVDYGVAKVHNELHEPNQLWQFRGNPGLVHFDFTDKLFTAVPENELTPDQLQFRQYAEQDDDGEEDSWLGRLDVKRELPMGAESFVKFGAKFRNTDKGFDSNNTTYTRGSSANRFSLGDFDLQGPAVVVDAGRDYVNAPTIDADAIIPFTAANLASPMFVLDEEGTLADAVLGDFDVEEKVLAAYAMANLQLGIVTLTPGLRVERTKLDVTGFELANETEVQPTSGSSSYTNWLPSIVGRINPAEDMIVRLAYTRSIGRPQYADLSPGAELGFEANGDGTFDGSLSLGNPDLKPYVAENLDASFEYYFGRGGLVSLGVFAKFISDPIFGRSFVETDTTYNGRDYARLEISQPENADSGTITGFEAAYQQQFTALPGLLSGFGINLNLALIHSELKVPGRTEDATFPSQSDVIYGGQLFYQKGPLEASIAYHNTGKSLLSLGGEPLADQYSDDFRRLDFKASVGIVEGIDVFFEAQNLTDEPTRQYQGGHRDWVIQNERYGRTFYLGFSARL